MNITEIRYTRKFNLGNYETEEIGVAANLEGLEDVSQAFRELKQTVFGLQAEGVDVESPRATQTAGKPVPWSFSPEKFLNHIWKGKRKEDGSYAPGSCDWGWDFIYQDKERKQPNFDKDALKVLENGPVQIGDDYVVQFNESHSFVQIQKVKAKKSGAGTK